MSDLFSAPRTGWPGAPCRVTLAVVLLGALALAAPSAAQAPVNDHVYNATPIGAPGTATGPTVGATRGHDEFGAPCVPGGPPADNLQSVWWEYGTTTDGSGRLTVDLAGTDFDAVLWIEQGNGDVIACATGADARIDDIPLQSWRTYLIRVSGVGDAEGTAVVTVTRGPAVLPPNDDRAGATPILAEGLYFETNYDATSEPGEASASCADDDSGQSLWWRYTATADTLVTFDLNLGYYPVLSLHDADGAELACTTAGRIERHPLAAGETVYVRASNDSFSDGMATLSVLSGVNGRPANDDRAEAGPLALETSYNGTTAGATTEPGEAPASCAPDTDAGRSVWWRYDAPSSVMMSAELSYADVVSVYDEAGAELACSARSGSAPAGLDLVVLPAGRLYVRVSDTAAPAAPGVGGDVYFTFRVTPALTNDDSADATAFDTPGTLLGTTVTATAEADEPVLPETCFDSGYFAEDTNESAWWSYTATADGTLLVDTDGSEFDTILSVHDEALAPLACNNDDPTNDHPLDDTSRLANVPVVAGQRVLVRVSGNTVGGGRPTTGDVHLSLEVLPPATVSAVASGTTAGGPTWTRPLLYGQVCGISFSEPSFHVTPFTVPTAGYYSFTGRFDGHSGAVFVFLAPFDAEVWSCDAIVAYGYASAGAPTVAMAAPVTLDPGTNYVLVASGYDADDAGPYTVEALGPAPVAFNTTVAAADAPTAARGLSAPRPNPTRAGAAFTLTLDRAERVTVEVFNALGQRVAVLHEGPLAAGVHDLAFDGRTLPAGVYAVRASGDSVRETQRVTVVR